ncbi:MAG: fibronectin type III domain-containing protein, partial [Chloroflexota bacterium]
IGAISNAPGAKTYDIIPPGAITNLAASAIFGTSVTLTWTATGDNGAQGQAIRYDLRYTTIESLEGFVLDGSMAVAGLPAPKQAAYKETFTVSGLSSNTTYFFMVRATDEVGLVGNASNIAKAVTLDLLPPGQITNLAVAAVFGGSMTLNWTATGDDGDSGTASAYDLRLAIYPILSTTSFNAATKITGLPTPLPAGNAESFILSGLQSDSTYYVCIRAVDETGNIGPLSLSISANTLDITPPARISNLALQSAGTDYTVLSWIATGDNGYSGQAASYDLRFATFSLPSGIEFDPAAAVPRIPSPRLAGSPETATVSGLEPDTTFYFALKVLDEAGLASGLSNSATAHTLDIVPPGPVTDLAAAPGSFEGEIVLEWTAVGDNGTQGLAEKYIVKISTGAMGGEGAAFAPAFTQSIVPKTPGLRETLTLTGLVPGTSYYSAVFALDEAGNRGMVSNIASAWAQRDLIEPDPISDLSATAVGPMSILLSWTAPGDDGFIGRAMSYDIRYSTQPINDSEAVFAEAVPISGAPAPSTPGTRETFTAADLPADIELFFALRVFDNAGNFPGLSNPTAGIAPGEPFFLASYAPFAVRAGTEFDFGMVVVDAAGLPVPGLAASLTLVSGNSQVLTSTA